jgi:hypothetical protein
VSDHNRSMKDGSEPTSERSFVARLGERVGATPLVGLALPLVLYKMLGVPGLAAGFSVAALLAVGVALLLRAPRWLVWSILALPVLLSTYQAVFVAAQGSQDAMADRDEAAETACAAFLRGENPWARPTMLGSQITTGPASVLLLSPVVAATGKIDLASFLFWLAFVGVFAVAELRIRTTWSVPLALFYLLGAFEIDVTQYWALEELYYAMLVLAAAYWFAECKCWRLVGAALAVCVLSRPNYAFLVLALLAWAAQRQGTTAFLRSVTQGAVIATVLVIAPVWLIAGAGALPAIPWSTGSGTALAPGLAGLWMRLPGIVRLLAGLLTLGWLTRPLGRCAFAHPFWHMTAAGFVAHTLVWYSSHLQDYALMFVIPALWGVAHSAPLATVRTATRMAREITSASTARRSRRRERS